MYSYLRQRNRDAKVGVCAPQHVGLQVPAGRRVFNAVRVAFDDPVMHFSKVRRYSLPE